MKAFFLIISMFPLIFAANLQWMVFDTSNSDISFNMITNITIDTNGNVWFINHTDKSEGIVKFDMNIFSVFDQSNFRLLINGISSIYIDDNNNLWVGLHWDYSLVDGIIKFDGSSWNLYDPEYISESTRIHAILRDLDNNIWIGRWAQSNVRGLDKYIITNNSWNKFTTGNSPLPENDIFSLALDKSNNLWIGTDGGGVAKFDRTSNWDIYNTSNSSLPNNKVTAICEDDSSNVWIGTWGGGIAKYNTVNGWEIMNVSNSNINSDYISSIIKDGMGNIWLAVNGIAKYENGDFIIYDTTNSDIPYGSVFDLSCDIYNNIWIGTRYGLVVFNENGISIEEKIEMLKQEGIIVFPNPFNASLSVRLCLEYPIDINKDFTITIFDIKGRILQQEKTAVKTDRVISLPPLNLANGLYFVKLVLANKSYTKKILVSK